MSGLTRSQQQALIAYLRTLDGESSVQEWRARFPEAQALDPYLKVRERLLAVDMPEGPAAAYASGRQALLEQLAQPTTHAASGPMTRLRATFADGWQSRLVRTAAAAAIVFALVGGGLGASAAAGVDRAHDVLSALHIVAPASNEQQPPAPTPGGVTPNSNGGQKNVPGAVDEGRPTDDAASSGHGTGNDGSGEGRGPCDSKDATPGSQTLASPCTPAENEGSAAHTPSRNDENTPIGQLETPHGRSGEIDQGKSSHPENGANITPPPVDDGPEGGSRGGTTEHPASSLPTDEHGNP